MRSLLSLRHYARLRRVSIPLFLLGALCSSNSLSAQDTPLLSGGVGFFTATNGGNTSYQMLAVPVLEAPIGKHVLIESRGNLLESFSPQGNGQGGSLGGSPPGMSTACFRKLPR